MRICLPFIGAVPHGALEAAGRFRRPRWPLLVGLFLLVELADRAFAGLTQRGELLGDGLPDGFAYDIGIVMAEPIADAANVGPGLIGRELLGEKAELGGAFTVREKRRSAASYLS